MRDVDTGGGDRKALAVLGAEPGGHHPADAFCWRQRYGRSDPAALVKLRAEGLVEQITLARASRMRVRFPTQ